MTFPIPGFSKLRGSLTAREGMACGSALVEWWWWGTCRRKGVPESPTAPYLGGWNSSWSERKVMASEGLREEKIGSS